MGYGAEAGTATICLTGDAMITRRMSVYDEPQYLGLVEIIRSADVAITNAEMLFHNYENPASYIPGGTYMRAHPRMIEELEWLGISMVASANNHAYDFDENGLLQHLNNLEAAGIAHAGIGRDASEARAPSYLETAAGRVGLVSVTFSGPPALYAQYASRDTIGRPGANMIRYTNSYTVDRATFEIFHRFRDEFGLSGGPGKSHWRRFQDLSLGLSQLPDSATDFFMADLHDEWQYPHPAGYRFRLGDGFGRRAHADELDVAENLQRISDARRMADWVVVSIHSHEDGATADEPSEILVDFAHAAIDAGADIVHGHGPHRDRGIEVYRGRPIFYSIGHFIFQNDTIERIPLDNLLRQGLSAAATPADFADARSGREWMNEWSDGARNPDRWRDVIALADFEDHALRRIRLVPIDLGFQRRRFQRGRPMLATGKDAEDVIGLFQKLSARWNTHIEWREGIGMIDVNKPDPPEDSL